MTESNRQPDIRNLRYLHEILFSWSIAFLAMSLIFLFASNLSIPFIHLEISINHFLGIRQTDLIRGYFTYLISSGALALCMSIVLHAFSDQRLTKWILRSGSGAMVLFSPPVFWFCYYQVVGWPFRWPYRWAPVELSTAAFCLTLYLLGKWTVPGWVSVLLLAAHYNYWYWTQSSNPEHSGYTGPIAPILCFCSALAWIVYVARLRSNHDVRRVEQLA